MASVFEAAEERRVKLEAEHGKPRIVTDTAAALRLLGVRDQVHPLDAVAFWYRDRAAATAWAASNLEHRGHPSLGTALMEGGEVIGILDLRPSLAADGFEPADPSLPDDWPRYKRREVS